MSDRLSELRTLIDDVDHRLLALLGERGRLVLEVGELKHAENAPVLRPEREAQILRRLAANNPGPLAAGAIAAIWREVISACRELERRLRVGYLGPVGTFSEQAVFAQFGHGVDAVPCASIDEVFRAAEAGTVDFGVVPVENSTEGAVNRSLDLFLQSPLRVCGEVSIPIKHNLLTASGSMDGVTRICAHAQALAQCTGWLNRNHPSLERVPVSSNAEGARLAALEPHTASIAGDGVLGRYEVRVVAEAIQDDPLNRTRFAVVGQHVCGVSGEDQTSLILSVADRAGAVHALIEPLARHGVSMKRFESRPARQGGWQYYFYIDLLGHEQDPQLAAALAEIRAHAAFFKSLGSYPREVALSRTAARAWAHDAPSHATSSPSMSPSAPAELAPAHVRAIAPYQAGKPISEVAREYGLDEAKIVKLASNENPLGMPESARAAMMAVAAELGRYPDANGFELKAALSKRLEVPQDWLTLGNGSNDILELVAHALLQSGTSAVYSQYSFAVYALATQETGARAIVVPARDHGHDLAAMRAAIAPDTRIVFIANPNNPTGTFLPAAEVEAFLASVPPQVVVVLDEAYNEYLEPTLRVDAVAWVRRFPNLVLSRTFSKAYGLAGLRVGYAVAQPAMTDLLNRVRQPFNVNSLAQAAAVAALGDAAFLERSRVLNAEGVARLQSAFDALGLPYVKSFGNFVLVKVGDAAGINQALLRAGVIVRPVGNYGLPEWLRISVGLPAENEAFLVALRAALGRA